MLVGRFLSRTIYNLVGHAYPIYMSVQAAKKENSTDEHIQWVVFWTVNACFGVFEIFVDFLGNYIPFYYEAKVCMIAWLALPQFHGLSTLAGLDGQSNISLSNEIGHVLLLQQLGMLTLKLFFMASQPSCPYVLFSLDRTIEISIHTS
ncbi:Aste57867_7486 [Aphanomyces stellatus]|uniref:Aste57867_4854 protein n=1 Tax=Aphanomyces stellatus TaxID=120398 RepID=A0A485KID4_9STRA|nr:hypothetical protein As57867_007460 [Aphanomyces stellatus]KAF0712359.1 hypothetical protein As57867_004841 [Aphanomyces stellatus]VFT81947.1 Aste57867_4854 [Aphanomyces stellatus]VFT84396.1 Aste57867_7486 [Aphanomyces stellatus]